LDDGVRLFTVDDVLREAMKYAERRIIPESFINWRGARAERKGVTPASDLILVVGSVDPDQITHDMLLSLSWRQFKEMIADLWSRFGYRVELTPRTRHGGPDIVALRDVEGVGQVTSYIECKRYPPDRKVGVDILRQLYFITEHYRVNKGILVTTSTLTPDAQSFLEQFNAKLEVCDSRRLIDLMRKTHDSR
jgi:restriction system protein